MSGFPLASENGENFGFGYGSITAVQVNNVTQAHPQQEQNCKPNYGINVCVKLHESGCVAGYARRAVDAHDGEGQSQGRPPDASVHQSAGLRYFPLRGATVSTGSPTCVDPRIWIMM